MCSMYRLDRFNRSKEYLKYAMPFGKFIYPPVSQETLKKDYGGSWENAPAIVMNKDGVLLCTWSYRGPDLDSEIKERLAMITVQLNNLFSSLNTGWVLYFEAQRLPALSYATDTYFPDKVTQTMDDERKAIFLDSNHFESAYYATACWLPPSDQEGRMREFMVEGHKHNVVSANDNVAYFWEHVNKIISSFYSLNIPSHFLTRNETLTYLHSTVSDHPCKLTAPKHPLLLDSYLFDTPLYGGLEPKLGKKHLRVIVPIVYSADTCFGLFDRINRLNFGYRWVTRFFCMSKPDSISTLEKIKRGWKGKIKSIISTIKAILLDREDDGNTNENAVRKFDEVKDAITAVEGDYTNYGHYSTAILVMDEDVEIVEKKAKAVRQEFVNLGMDAKIEDLNAVDAWLGCIPGNVGRFIRRPIISTGNLVHMMPISNVWAGPERNEHLKGPVLLYTQTDGNTPFRLCLHIGSIGHALLVGPTGAGKSVHLNMLAASFRKYKDARVIIFDKGASSRVLTEGVGGRFYDLGREKMELSFQPLARIDDEHERQWALEWLLDYVRQENVTVTPNIKKDVWDALQVLSDMPKSARSITGLIDYVQNQELKNTFEPLSIKGSYGYIFDSIEDNLEFSSWQVFEMEKLMQTPEIVAPVLMYIFHRIEASLDGSPTLISLDEGWVFLNNAIFAEKLRDWFKTLRKANASVVLATQSLADITTSAIFPTILESCQSRIFLANPDALEEGIKKTYTAFGLNQRQIEIIASAIPKKDYYYDSPLGSRIYDLALTLCPYTMAYVGATDKIDSKYCQKVVEEFGKEHFNEHWLAYKNIEIST
jgi:type IV secretion system protein TrbE